MAEWKKIIVSGSGVAQLSNDANYLTDYTVTSGDVTAHEGDITITESQISDFGTYSTATGVENNADVTDTANVTAAGALMDSEVTDLAGIKSVTISTLQVKPSEGAFADGDKTKLDGIETGADVTDTANVTAAGALMDSEVTNLAQVKAFDSSDYATAAQGLTADSAVQPSDSVTSLSDVTNAGSGKIISDGERISIGALNTFTGSLNANFATDAELAAVSGALASDLSSIDTAVPAIVDNSGTPAFNSGITKSEVLSILNVADGAQVNVGTNITISEGTNTVEVQSSTGTNDSIAAATTSAAGVMTSSDKAKLDGIASGAEVNVDTNITVSEGASTVEIQSSTGTNDSIAAATTSAAGVMTATDKTKLDGIETSADVTDTANVTAAGALMDSELTSIDDVKALDQSVSSGATPVFGTANMTDASNKRFMSDAQESKLDSVETNADVTDTANVKSALNANLGTLTIGDSNDTITIGNDLVVTGDLTVSGNTTTVDVANLNVTDQFINLNDGGAAADGGIVVEGAGVSFGWDNSESRWAFDAAGATEDQTAIGADAYASAVVTSDLAAYRKNGNIRVTGGDIFIYTE